MRFGIFASIAAAIIGVACAAGSASASTLLVDGSCISVTDDHGCLFQGVINDQYFDALDLGAHPNSYLNAVNAYNAYVALNPSAGSAININPIGQTLNIPSTGDLTDPIVAQDGSTVIGEVDFTATTSAKLMQRSGTWELYDGQPAAQFLAVDAGNQFVLYELSDPTTSGDWDTFDIPGTIAGQTPKLYRLVLFTDPPVVPEPGTWVMLLLGFGLIGATLRTRRQESFVSLRS
jgi:hypothetical protein